MADAALTIDELARRTGMTVRNIRAHQSRGLLPAPQVRGRTGYYGAEHEQRINLIRELQARRLQARGDQPAPRQRRRLERRGAALHPRGQGPVRGRAAGDRHRRRARRAMGRRRGGAGAPARRPRGSGSCARCPTATIEELCRGSGGRAASLPRSGSRPRRRSTSPQICASTPTRSQRPSSTCSSARSGARSRIAVARRTTCPRSATRSSASARSPPTRCSPCSSS